MLMHLCNGENVFTHFLGDFSGVVGPGARALFTPVFSFGDLFVIKEEQSCGHRCMCPPRCIILLNLLKSMSICVYIMTR